jgi:hypothetical protein
MNSSVSAHIESRAKSAFLWSHILNVPFWGLINLLCIILYKDMHISALHVTAIIALKPMSALIAPYWSKMIYKRPEKIVPNLIGSHLLRYIPFLFLYWIESPWIITLFFGMYMALYRGGIPAWMELFRSYIPEGSREKFVSYGTVIDYCGTALLPLLLGTFLDHKESSWRALFPLTAILGLFSLYFLYRIPKIPPLSHPAPPKEDSIKNNILSPWKQGWDLVKKRPDFANYQIGFLLGGAGLIIIQPMLPTFFVDELHLSYTKLLVALTLCKGIGLILTSRIWTHLFRKLDIHRLSALVVAIAALFPIILIGAQGKIFLLYLAYGIYGAMQAGSELSWKMSGPVFAKQEDSSFFSSVNIMAVGIRGCVVPFLGSFIGFFTSATVVMLLGSFLSLLSAGQLLGYNARVSKTFIMNLKSYYLSRK